MLVTSRTIAEALSAIMPNFSFGEDNDGQLVIYTNLRETYMANVYEDMDA